MSILGILEGTTLKKAKATDFFRLVASLNQQLVLPPDVFVQTGCSHR